jgi:uncharacterized damage-inducible protein DinB
MSKEIQSIIANLQSVLSGEPWYGEPVYKILEDAGKTDVFKHPAETQHSQIEILYHMLTWSEFTLNSIQQKEKDLIENIEALDWRVINPKEHTWENGVALLKESNKNIIELLQASDDNSLDDSINLRKYNKRFLLNGLIQHHIYHIGQIAYLKNLCR